MSCEAIHMNGEEDGGMGCFDGNPYVFGCNGPPIDGEEDAWLDGTSCKQGR